MKKIFFSCILVLWAAGSHAQTSAAPPARTPEQRADHLTNWMSKKLALTADQKSKIYDVNLKYAKMNQELKSSDTSKMKKLHQELKTSEQEREADFKTILTADQFKTFLTAKQQLAERRLERKR